MNEYDNFESSFPPLMKDEFPLESPSQNENMNGLANSKEFRRGSTALFPLKNKNLKQFSAGRPPVSNTIRAGDWICLICNNLNFSFRNECNRCQIQTKKQNFIQNLIMLSGSSSLHQANIDALQKLQPQYQNSTNNGLSNSSKSSQQQTCENQAPLIRKPLEDISNNHENSDINIDCSIQKSFIQTPQCVESDVWNLDCAGFENAVLITPPKYRKQHCQYYYDGTQSPGEGMITPNQEQTKERSDFAYRSPSDVPSVSPLLNRMKEETDNSYQKKKKKDFVLQKKYEYFSDTFEAPSFPNEQNNRKQASDWVCLRCKNVNYFFRQMCNRCHASKNDM